MKYEVHRCHDGEIEYLPDITETSIWEDYSDDRCPRSVRVVAALYRAVTERDNYYQWNSPTAFGDPLYQLALGTVIGILQGAEITETEENDKLVFRKGRRIILVVDKIHKHQSYYDTKKEIREAWKAIM